MMCYYTLRKNDFNNKKQVCKIILKIDSKYFLTFTTKFFKDIIFYIVFIRADTCIQVACLHTLEIYV